jgi:hypothetical protein
MEQVFYPSATSFSEFYKVDVLTNRSDEPSILMYICNSVNFTTIRIFSHNEYDCVIDGVDYSLNTCCWSHVKGTAVMT